MNFSKKSFKHNWFTYLFFLSIIVSLYIAYIFTTPPIPHQNHPIYLYSNKTCDDIKLLFLRSIYQAKKNIHLQIYSLKDLSLIKALKKQSHNNIDITIICDKKASRGIDKKLGNFVRTIYSNSKGLMHRKILVIDNKISFIGSANMTLESLRMHSNLTIGLYSPQLAQKIIDYSFENLSPLININDLPLELWLLPSKDQATQRIKELIQSAQKQIRVGMFVWTQKEFAEEILAAYNRGIKVDVILDKNSAWGCGASIYSLFQKNQIPCHLNFSEGLFHHKLMIIDDSTLILGSANWTKAAFTQNKDCFIVLHLMDNKNKAKLNRLWNILQLETT